MFKMVTEEDPRGLLDMADALPLDAIATVTPLERELTRSPLYIDTAFEVKDAGGRRIEHLEGFSKLQNDDLERVARYGLDLASKFFLPIWTTILLMVEAHDPGPIPTEGV